MQLSALTFYFAMDNRVTGKRKKYFAFKSPNPLGAEFWLNIFLEAYCPGTLMCQRIDVLQRRPSEVKIIKIYFLTIQFKLLSG